MAERYEHIIRTALEGDVESHQKLVRLEQDLYRIGTTAGASGQQVLALRKVAADLAKVEVARVAQGRLNATAGPAGFGHNLNEFLAGRQTNRPVSLLARLGAATQGQRISDEGMVRQVGLPVAVKAMFAMYMAKSAVQGITNLSKEGGNLKAATANFEAISGGAEAAAKRLAKFNDALNGTVADSVIERGAASINLSGAKGSDGKPLDDATMARLFKGVTQLGRNAPQGFSAEDSIKRLTESIATGHSSELEKIIPGFDPEAAKARFTEDSGLTSEEIKNAPGLEQSITAQEAVRALDEALKKTSQQALNAGDASAQLQAQILNAKDKLVEGVGASKEFNAAVGAMTEAIKNATPGVVGFAKGALGAAASPTGQNAARALAAGAVGAKLGSTLGPEGAAVGAAAGIVGSYAWNVGSYSADSADAGIKKRDAAFAKQFAEPASFDQSAYDKEQSSFVNRLAGMSDSEYSDFRKSGEKKGIDSKNSQEAAELAANASILNGGVMVCVKAADSLATAMLQATAAMLTFGQFGGLPQGVNYSGPPTRNTK